MKLGTRGSDLALWQAREVTRLLAAGGVTAELEIITTKGDISLQERLQGGLEKGFFTEEIQHALRTERVEAAVHSFKDLPTLGAEGLCVGAVLTRAPAHDIVIARPEAVDRQHARLALKAGAVVGASSLRREALLAAHAPWAKLKPLRGNVPTRLRKLREGEYDAIILAAAGVSRLGLDVSGLEVLATDPKHWQPAPGQGAVAVECRQSDARTVNLLAVHCHHAESERRTRWERMFLRVLEGGCTTPFGAYVEGQEIWLGIASNAGWRTLHAPLPAGVPDEKSTFIRETLARLDEEGSLHVNQ
jgi:hydroxymethylbilane synthase